MLYQQVRRSFWLRHPLVASAAALVTVWLLWSGSYALVAVVGIAWLAIAVRKRARTIARRDAGLRARAEYEHRLTLTGDPRGIHGRYPPVQPGWFPDPHNRRQLRYFDGGLWTGYTVSTTGQ